MKCDRRPTAGLTMAELVLALGLLATILISVVGLFMSLLGSSAKSSNQTVGHYFAQQKLEEAVLKGNFNEDGSETDIYSMDAANKTHFAYRVRATAISHYAGDVGYRGGYYVQVSVYWWNGELNEARAGQGLLHTGLGRFCYPGPTVP